MCDVFEREVAAHYAPLLKLALRLSKNLHEAEDLVQDTLLKALTHRRQFTQGTNLSAWLKTILRNHFLTGRRNLKRGMFISSMHDDVSTSGWLELQGAVARPTQESTLELKMVIPLIEKLPPYLRDGLLGWVEEDKSYEAIAETSGTPIGTVKNRVHRARRRLMELANNARVD